MDKTKNILNEVTQAQSKCHSFLSHVNPSFKNLDDVFKTICGG